MDILSVSAESKLCEVAMAIVHDPESWEGWSCLRIEWGEASESLQQECLFWTKSIIDAYLAGVEGRVYFCENRSIDIVCRDVSEKVLGQTGRQICDLVYSESSIDSEYKTYNLRRDAMDYAHRVLQKSMIRMAVDAVRDGDKNRDESAGVDESAKPILNSSEYPKVLLVEDDPVTRWMVRNALKHECHFATASDGGKVFSMYPSFQPDLVFLDINLPDMNGYDILKWIVERENPARVVMFSGNDGLDNIADALRNGASGFISKPFLKESLLHYIRICAG